MYFLCKAIADGACEARSRSDEEAMLIHRRRIATTRSPATPIGPPGCGATMVKLFMKRNTRVAPAAFLPRPVFTINSFGRAQTCFGRLIAQSEQDRKSVV